MESLHFSPQLILTPPPPPIFAYPLPTHFSSFLSYMSRSALLNLFLAPKLVIPSSACTQCCAFVSDVYMISCYESVIS
jgi:hypothetical protein